MFEAEHVYGEDVGRNIEEHGATQWSYKETKHRATTIVPLVVNIRPTSNFFGEKKKAINKSPTSALTQAMDT